MIALQNPTFPIILVLAYVVMALPLAYRALDAGLRAIEVRTLHGRPGAGFPAVPGVDREWRR
jgi:ABC-type spermidine/putrescine transport system permease subunit II